MRTDRVSGRRPAPIFIVALALLLPVAALSQDSTDSLPDAVDRFSGSIGIATSYDDNFLAYSPHEIAQFNDGVRPAKFLVTNTADVVTTLRARASVVPGIFEDAFRTQVRGRLNRSWNRTNAWRAYTTWGVELRQSLWERDHITFQFSSLPVYYLRNLFYRRYRQPSRLPSQYIPEEISKKGYGVALGRRFSPKASVEIAYRQERATYNKEFYERSNTAREYTVDAEYRLSRSVRGGVAITFAEVWAHGRDDFSAPAHDSLADISSRSVRAVLSSSVSLRRMIGLPVELQPELTLEHQAYLSGKPGDIYHFGRIDRYAKLALEIRYQLRRELTCTALYSWEQNRTNLGDTGDAGSYQEHRAGLGVEYTF